MFTNFLISLLIIILMKLFFSKLVNVPNKEDRVFVRVLTILGIIPLSFILIDRLSEIEDYQYIQLLDDLSEHPKLLDKYTRKNCKISGTMYLDIYAEIKDANIDEKNKTINVSTDNEINKKAVKAKAILCKGKN